MPFTPKSVRTNVCFLPQLTVKALTFKSVRVWTIFGGLVCVNKGPSPKQPAVDTPIV